MNKLKKNDKVVVLTGKDKGKTGEVLVLCQKSGRIKVKGISIATQHVKPTRKGESGSIQKMESFIQASNVMLLDPMTGEPVRIRGVKRT